MDLQFQDLDIDHITSIEKGLDNEQNWALTHKTENQSKGDRDLQLMQHIFGYRKDRKDSLAKFGDFTAGNALDIFFPKRKEVLAQILEGKISG